MFLALDSLAQINLTKAFSQVWDKKKHLYYPAYKQLKTMLDQMFVHNYFKNQPNDG